MLRGAMVQRVARGVVAGLLLAGLGGCSFADDSCSGLEEYADLGDVEVTLLAAADQAEPLRAALGGFTECTGAGVRVQTPQANRNVTTELTTRLQAETPPDVALISHGQLNQLGRGGGVLREAPESVVTALESNFADTWKQVMSVSGKVYGVPVNLEMKSLVWYSPSRFREQKWAEPQTWEDLKALTRNAAAANLPEGVKPWCAGFASGGSESGWPGTDWVEDLVLRQAGVAVYDQWVSHQIPFNDQRIVKAVDQVSAVLRNDDFANGGFGSAAGIAQTPIIDAGLPILSGECVMHRQADFYGWPPGTSIAKDGDVWAFYLPPLAGGSSRPMLGGGDVAVTLADSQPARALQTYFATPEFANARAGVAGSTGWVSANQRMDPETLPTAIDRQVAQWLQQDDITFRYDGSDEMPEKIASDVFWQAMLTWISTKQSSKAMLDSVEKEWP